MPNKKLKEQISLFAIENESVESTEVSAPIPVDLTSAKNEEALLALSSIQGIGFGSIRNLFNHFKGELFKVWQYEGEDLFDLLSKCRVPRADEVTRRMQGDKEKTFELARTQSIFLKNRAKVSVVFRYSPKYPAKLEKLKDPPAWLFVQGNAQLLHEEKIVAVVGTRMPTHEGIEAARKVSVELVRENCIILSGLAEGIDEVSHDTAVAYDAPTIAVLGHGLEVTFPAKTADLRKQIVRQGGAIISEYLLKDSYAKEKFVQRNRLQAALSSTVIVVEAKSKSGTAHTARFTKNLNIPLIGITMGDLGNIPNHQLLADLKKEGRSIFDIGCESGREDVRTYFRKLFQSVSSTYRFEPRLFSGTLSEVIRRGKEFDASKDDIDWLINELYKLKQNYR